jgi:hypothetical protein
LQVKGLPMARAGSSRGGRHGAFLRKVARRRKRGLPRLPRLAKRAHLVTTTGNLLLPRPARNERGEGHPVEWASSPQPSPPVGEEREPISSHRLVVLTRCALAKPRPQKILCFSPS